MLTESQIENMVLSARACVESARVLKQYSSFAGICTTDIQNQLDSVIMRMSAVEEFGEEVLQHAVVS